jgi:hypothetical protein
LKWDRHFVIGLTFALPGALLAFASYSSSPFCGAILGRISSCGYLIDYETLSIGAVLGFLGLTEFIVAFKRKKEGELFWESDSQRTTRKIGMTAMLIGVLTSLFTFAKVENISALAPWSVSGVYGISFYSGLIMVAVGAGLIMGSRFLKIKPMKAAADRVLLARAQAYYNTQE